MYNKGEVVFASNIPATKGTGETMQRMKTPTSRHTLPSLRYLKLQNTNQSPIGFQSGEKPSTDVPVTNQLSIKDGLTLPSAFQGATEVILLYVEKAH